MEKFAVGNVVVEDVFAVVVVAAVGGGVFIVVVWLWCLTFVVANNTEDGTHELRESAANRATHLFCVDS
jgi:hypothetical protein